jgi:hypothetical protein
MSDIRSSNAVNKSNPQNTDAFKLVPKLKVQTCKYSVGKKHTCKFDDPKTKTNADVDFEHIVKNILTKVKYNNVDILNRNMAYITTVMGKDYHIIEFDELLVHMVDCHCGNTCDAHLKTLTDSMEVLPFSKMCLGYMYRCGVGKTVIKSNAKALVLPQSFDTVETFVCFIKKIKQTTIQQMDKLYLPLSELYSKLDANNKQVDALLDKLYKSYSILDKLCATSTKKIPACDEKEVMNVPKMPDDDLKAMDIDEYISQVESGDTSAIQTELRNNEMYKRKVADIRKKDEDLAVASTDALTAFQKALLQFMFDISRQLQALHSKGITFGQYPHEFSRYNSATQSFSLDWVVMQHQNKCQTGQDWYYLYISMLSLLKLIEPRDTTSIVHRFIDNFEIKVNIVDNPTNTVERDLGHWGKYLCDHLERSWIFHTLYPGAKEFAGILEEQQRKIKDAQDIEHGALARVTAANAELVNARQARVDLVKNGSSLQKAHAKAHEKIEELEGKIYSLQNPWRFFTSEATINKQMADAKVKEELVKKMRQVISDEDNTQKRSLENVASRIRNAEFAAETAQVNLGKAVKTSKQNQIDFAFDAESDMIKAFVRGLLLLASYGHCEGAPQVFKSDKLDVFVSGNAPDNMDIRLKSFFK